MTSSFISSVIKANEEISRGLDGVYDKSYFRRGKRGAGGDISSGLDMMAESVFAKYLSEFGQIESEESGIIGEGSATIIIDPIDGSSNALSMFPYFGTSVALIGKDGVLEAAIVCNLASKEIFVRENGRELMWGKLFENPLQEYLPAPDTEIGIFEKAYAQPEIVMGLSSLGLKFRSPGAIAVSLAYAHSVGYVLFVGSYRIYDFAAGLALCEGLEVIVEEDYVIVSKDKNIAQKLEQIVKESLKK